MNSIDSAFFTHEEEEIEYGSKGYYCWFFWYCMFFLVFLLLNEEVEFGPGGDGGSRISRYLLLIEENNLGLGILN